MQVNSDLENNKLNNELFSKHLKEETALLKEWFDNKRFIDNELEVGSEVEFLILDDKYMPAPRNLEIISECNEPRLVPEVGSAQLEINATPQNLSGHCLTRMHEDIANIFHQTNELAHRKKCHLALIGSMPVNNEMYYQQSYMTNTKRLNILQNYLVDQSPVVRPLRLKGNNDKIHVQAHSEWALCGLISAFQLHLKVSLENSVRFYNTAQVISAPMLALCCNSPFFRGQQLWSESRISLFEQIHIAYEGNYAQHGLRTAVFGKSYMEHSFFELFQENSEEFPAIIPEVCADAPIESMFHMRGQNSLIYRWNRPILDFNSKGDPHLRIEHRSPSTGPTVLDMIANSAFYYGIMNYFATASTPIEKQIPFRFAKKNFYNAAQFGLNAQFHWTNDRVINACALIKQLIPLAFEGLSRLGITESDAKYYLGVIQRRVNRQQNGSSWQQAFITRYGKDFSAMLEAFVENQDGETPISDWKLSRYNFSVMPVEKMLNPINQAFLDSQGTAS